MNNFPAHPAVQRQGTRSDLEAINRLIGRAIDTWKLSARVKRLSLPSYQYDAIDLDHLEVTLIEEAAGQANTLLAVATRESADPADLPAGKSGLLLHGLYVTPEAWGRGLGTRLLRDCAYAAQQQGVHGVLVKATRDSEGYFASRGLHLLPVCDPHRDFPRRYWLEVQRRPVIALPGERPDD